MHWEKMVCDLTKDVHDDPYAVGYTGMTYVDQSVRVIPLSDHAGDASTDNARGPQDSS